MRVHVCIVMLRCCPSGDAGWMHGEDLIAAWVWMILLDRKIVHDRSYQDNRLSMCLSCNLCVTQGFIVVMLLEKRKFLASIGDTHH